MFVSKKKFPYKTSYYSHSKLLNYPLQLTYFFKTSKKKKKKKDLQELIYHKDRQRMHAREIKSC